MKKLFLPLAIASIISFSSCGGGEHSETSTAETTQESADPICLYQFDQEATTSINWIAFKTSAKKGVGGQFMKFNVSGGEKSSKITDVLNTIKFSINTASTNTGNEGRDEKIKSYFFGSMEGSDLIIGQVKSVDGNNESGSCIVFLTMNGVENEVNLDYTVADNAIQLSGLINVLDFSADAALKALNDACKDLHTGEDGKSVTWPDVELSIETTLKKDCH